ncbi:MAG: M23 family metallopeptidase [Ruminiclostridium sp.]|nr:M23 family metallopeptidase [Ruminiclostridium sp.]
MKKARFTNGVQGKGFAAALVLSICAVGLSTYAAYRGAAGSIDKDEVEVYDDNVFVFTEPAETVNAEQTGIPKESAVVLTEEEEVTVEPVSVDEAGLVFKAPKTMPVAGASVINPYSGGELVKSETLGVWKTHDGADLAAPVGTAVSAMMKGVVSEVKNDPLWGICVVIDHGDGVIGHYCGLAENVAVKAGQEVSMGEIIGQVGETADAECKLEPHLHFGVTVGGAWTDPIKFIED